MTLISETLDGNRIGYKGRLYIAIPVEIDAEDAAVVGSAALEELGREYDRDVAKYKTQITNLEAIGEKLKEAVFEAHTMGRLYSKGGEKLKPADEHQRVNEMIDRYIAAAQAASESEGEL